jgi:hypothetical protein
MKTKIALMLLISGCALRQNATREDRRTPRSVQHSGEDVVPVTTTPPPVAAGEFTAIDAILKTSCGGGSCHGPGAAAGVFVGNEAGVKAAAGKIQDRVRSGSMPAPGSGFSISPDAKTKLLAYVARQLAAAATTTPPTTAPATTMPPTTTLPPGETAAPKRLRECPPADDVGTPAAPLAFATDLMPILDKSCGGAGTCHGPGSQGRQVFADDEAKFKENGNGVLFHLKAGSMPIGRALSPEDKAKLIQYLCPAQIQASKIDASPTPRRTISGTPLLRSTIVDSRPGTSSPRSRMMSSACPNVSKT